MYRYSIVIIFRQIKVRISAYPFIIPGILSLQDGLEQGALKGGLFEQSGVASTHLHISPSQAVMMLKDVTGYPAFLLQASVIKSSN
jgi:hypothetical protein